MIYRDSHGKSLDDYPRPSVAVDTAVLTVRDALEVLVVRPDANEAWRLPGTFLHPGERLADAVLRSLRTKADVDGLSPAQLHVFDDPTRDPRGWVLSVAHLDIVPARRLAVDSERTQLIPVMDAAGLAFGHDAIVAEAVAAMRDRYSATPDPAGLLEDAFRMSELHALHETVASGPIQRDGFRRAMLPLLEPTGELDLGAPGRPAQLYRRR
ncbi:NUDIX hydrolase [Salinibacterium sp. ZJ70]|uniref:NUDIX hydrolase n=1 Tax=Salinibacterium sp. ZJ70 TaxID=2708084 RepID=UPI001420E6A3|nr:NUDIX hydrolase [Salinibacterium sp. ZJ70]